LLPSNFPPCVRDGPTHHTVPPGPLDSQCPIIEGAEPEGWCVHIVGCFGCRANRASCGATITPRRVRPFRTRSTGLLIALSSHKNATAYSTCLCLYGSCVLYLLQAFVRLGMVKATKRSGSRPALCS